MGTAVLLSLAIGGVFLFAWLGAVLTREDRPLGRFVARRFRFLVIGAVAVHLATGFWEETALTEFLNSAATLLLAMMFVPMLRRLQRKTENEAAARPR